MLEHLKIKNASKSALRLAVSMAGFILAQNISPRYVLLRLLSFLLVLIFVFLLSFFIPFLLLLSFLFFCVYFIWFCSLLYFLCFSLPYFPHNLPLVLVSFLPLLLSQFPFICHPSCFLLLHYWHFSSWPFYIFPLCFSFSPVSVFPHSVTLHPSDVPTSSSSSSPTSSYYSHYYSSSFKPFGLFCFHGKSSFHLSLGWPTSHWPAGLYISSNAAVSCLTSLQIHSYQSHFRCSVCYQYGRHLIILGCEDYNCQALMKPFGVPSVSLRFSVYRFPLVSTLHDNIQIGISIKL